MRRSWLKALPALLLGASALACSSAPPPARSATKRPELRTPAAKPARGASGMLPAFAAAQLDDEDGTGFLARRGDAAVLLVSVKGRWQARALGADGAPKGEPIDVGKAPPGIPVAALRASKDGYLALWAEPVDRNTALQMVALDEGGRPRGPASLVAQVTDDVSFVDVLPNAQGALVIWEIAEGDRFDVYAAAYAPGKPHRSPSLVARGVIGWEAVGTSRGAALVTVVDPKADTKAAAKDRAANGLGDRRGRVLLTEVDPSATPSAPAVVSDSPTAHVDVGIVEVGGRYLVTWTDERDIDAAVYLAAVDRGGKVATAPARATAPAGEQALVALVAPRSDAGAPGTTGPAKGARALLVWEDLLRGPGGDRLLHLATVGDDGALGAERSTLVFSAGGPPDLTADGDGFAAVTLAPFAAAAAPSSTPPIWPAYVRFGADLSVVASSPIRAEPFATATDGVPYVTRGLTCEGGACTVLASGAGSPATLAVVSLPSEPGTTRAPAYRDAPEPPPRLESLRSIFAGDHLARVAATDTAGGGALVAWVTYFLDGSTDEPAAEVKRGEEPLAATLAVRALSDKGALGEARVLSRRAHSIGGVALAPAPGGAGGVLAWVARDKGKPQVFATRLNAKGEKVAQKALTTIARKPHGGVPNEAADVAIAYAGQTRKEDEWIVAWSDTRDGNSEIYAAKIDRALKKIVGEKRVTEAAGDSAEVQIAVRGAETYLVWSDARDSAADGNADVYLTRLDTRSLRKLGDDTRLFASAAHSRTPTLGVDGAGLVVAWIEEPTGDAAGGDAGVRVARLDEKGGVLGAPSLVVAPDRSAVTSVALRCGASPACRGVLTPIAGESLTLAAFELPLGGLPGPVKPIGGLSGGVTQDVSPSLAGPAASWLFFGDDAVNGGGRVRWMNVAW
jgi:hypothetical protein